MKKITILSVLSLMLLTACSNTPEEEPKKVEEVINATSTEQEVGTQNIESTEEKTENVEAEEVENETKELHTALLGVDNAKCKTTPLTVKEFKANCDPLTETEIGPGILVKAMQVIPEGKKDEDTLEVGDSVILEFYLNEEKLDVPEQIFHTTWATDFLSLGVAYRNESDIYVYGTTGVDVPEYGYQYDGKTWKQVK